MLFNLLSINELTLIFLPNITHIYEVVCVYLENTTVKLTSLSHLLISLIAVKLQCHIKKKKKVTVFSLTSLFFKKKKLFGCFIRFLNCKIIKVNFLIESKRKN